MLRSNDCEAQRHAWQVATAAVVLLAGVCWAPPVGADDVPGTIGAGPIRKLVIDPHTPATLYAATGCAGVLKSRDGGSSWAPANTGLQTGLGPTHVEALAIDPSTPSTLYAGTYGVFKSTNSGGSWTAAGTGLPEFNPSTSALAIDPVTPGMLYAATVDGVYKSTDGARAWQRLAVSPRTFGTSVYALAIDPATPSTLYAGMYDGVIKSTNGGSTWSDVDTGLPFDPGVTPFVILALAIDPVTPSTLYAVGDGAGVFKSTNGGSTWSAASTGLPEPAFLAALAIDPGAPRTLYAGISPASNTGTSVGVFKSTDAAGTWSAVNTNPPEPAHVAAFAIDPVTPSTLYAAGGYDGCFRHTEIGNEEERPAQTLLFYEMVEFGSQVLVDYK